MSDYKRVTYLTIEALGRISKCNKCYHSLFSRIAYSILVFVEKKTDCCQVPIREDSFLNLILTPKYFISS